MINITLSAEAHKIMQYIEILPLRVTTTFNDRHRGLLIQGNPLRIGAIHWFNNQIVFGTASVTKSRKIGDKLKFDEADANLVLELRNTLPAGNISQNMRFQEILNIVAISFGLPVTTRAGQQPQFIHFEAEFDGHFGVSAQPEDEVFLQGSGNLKEKKCWFVWAFSLKKYRDWFLSNL